MIHILPVGDLKEHTEDTTCECNPKVDFDNDIVTHNYFDHRELSEEAQQIIDCDFCENITCKYHISSTDCELLENLSECESRSELEKPGSKYYREPKH